jgi:photosynthetic reaction center cytochrome c subunit
MSTAINTRSVRGPVVALLPLLVGGLLAGCEIPAKQSAQTGFRGTGMVDVQNPRIAAAKRDANQIPVGLAPAPAVGPPAGAVYQNVQVLGSLSVPQFARLMVAITSWVAPQEGCNYCHDGNNLASDAIYTKVVARRMLQMTQHINAQWQPHVAATGVTCWTCHRGQHVPSDTWYDSVNPVRAAHAGNLAGQNQAAAVVDWTSLPFDPFSVYLAGDAEIRMQSHTALPAGNRQSIKQTEWTYALMVHMSKSLGVNCTYCHNSRSFYRWEESNPQRTTAWHGIRMARDLNRDYLTPLAPVLPANRLGPLGDPAKIACGTCHKGVFKPLYGVSMLKDYPELAAPLAPYPPPAPPADAPVDPAATPPAEPATTAPTTQTPATTPTT